MISSTESLELSSPHDVICCVEICLFANSSTRYDSVLSYISHYLPNRYAYLTTNSTLHPPSWSDDSFLSTHVQFIQIGESRPPRRVLELQDATLELFIYQFTDEEIGILSNDDQISAHHYALPSQSLHGLWDSLVFDDDVQLMLLDYIQTSLIFGDAGVDQNIININRVILLHGPPGTGKTSLCKSLAQKLSIRLAHRFTYGKLIEINAHSLFSKFFSESGKLVQKMFEQIDQVIADEDSFVCVLLDEVESLTAARKTAMAGLEPSDALRVVNALLTQIDKYRFKKNVLVMATSNLLEAIDTAFLDRADCKQFIGEPSAKGCYEIMKGCLQELVRCKLIDSNERFVDWRELDLCNDSEISQTLYGIAQKCKGVSGRTLRKLPFLAHSRFVRQSRPASMMDFLCALERTIAQERGVPEESQHSCTISSSI